MTNRRFKIISHVQAKIAWHLLSPCTSEFPSSMCLCLSFLLNQTDTQRWSVSLGGGQGLNTKPFHDAMPKQSCRDEGFFPTSPPPQLWDGQNDTLLSFQACWECSICKAPQHSDDLQRGRRSDCSHDTVWLCVGTQLQQMKPEGAVPAKKRPIVTPAVMGQSM